MPDELDDKQVVAAVVDGDIESFALLVRRYHGPLFHLASNKLKCDDVALDAVQDAFISAFRSLHTYKPEFAFRTWLWTILLNQCRRHGARQAKRAATNASLPTLIDDDFAQRQTPDDVAMAHERAIVLRQLLEELPEAQADAIRFRFFGQLQYKEIAAVMQSSLSSAKQRVRYGLEALGRLVRDRNLKDSLPFGDSHEDRT